MMSNPPLRERPRGRYWSEFFRRLPDEVSKPPTLVTCFDMSNGILLHGRPAISYPDEFVH